MIEYRYMFCRCPLANLNVYIILSGRYRFKLMLNHWLRFVPLGEALLCEFRAQKQRLVALSNICKCRDVLRMCNTV